MGAISTIRSMAPAVVVSLLPKTAGSIARVGDDKYAPKEVRRATMVRESITLGQVPVYAAVIDRAFKALKNNAQEKVAQGEKTLFTDVMGKLGGNEKLFLAALAFSSNLMAEKVSRLIEPRNVWKKPNAKSADKVLESTPIPVTLIDETKGKQIPVEIEICEIVPTRRSKAAPKFDAGAKSPQVQFTSRPAMPQAFPAVNPFQVRVPSPPVARPTFSV